MRTKLSMDDVFSKQKKHHSKNNFSTTFGAYHPAFLFYNHLYFQPRIITFDFQPFIVVPYSSATCEN